MDAFRVEILQRPRDLELHRAEIDVLAAGACDLNVFFESWMLLPALQAFVATGLLLVLVRHTSGALTGLFPLTFDRIGGALRMPRLQLWQHRYCYLATPLVSRRDARATLDALLQWVESGAAPARYLDLHGLAGDGSLAGLLQARLHERPGWTSYAASYQRAVFRPHERADAGISKKHAKELRRLERRLAERGALSYRVLGADADPTPWVDAFLRLEASGWKGRAGSALADGDDSRAFFVEATREGQRRGQLQMLALEVGGEPVAMKVNLIGADGRGAFAFKIAYDERYAEYSPGILLEVYTMRHLAQHCPQIEWIDSCAREDHPMINRLWPERRPIMRLVLAGGSPLARAAVLSRSARQAAGRLKRRSTMHENQDDSGAVDAARIGSPWLGYDDAQMSTLFDRHPFQIAHRLADHPLLQLPRIVELARTLPESSVEYNAGDLRVDQDPSLTPRNGLSIEETLSRIETCRSWMVLKGVQQDPAYAELLDECLDQVNGVIGGRFPGMTARRCFIFVSSPGAVTPYHVDFEHNFLLQIRGRKFFKVFDPGDRGVLPEEARERMVSGGHRNLKFDAAFEGREHAFELLPGDGVHVPLSSPHWVRVGDDVSISFSVTFQTLPSHRVIATHQVNHQLRQWGLTPREVGRSPLVDALKFGGYRMHSKLQGLRRRAGLVPSKA